MSRLLGATFVLVLFACAGVLPTTKPPAVSDERLERILKSAFWTKKVSRADLLSIDAQVTKLKKGQAAMVDRAGKFRVAADDNEAAEMREWAAFGRRDDVIVFDTRGQNAAWSPGQAIAWMFRHVEKYDFAH